MTIRNVTTYVWDSPHISNPNILEEYLGGIGICGAKIDEIAIANDDLQYFSGMAYLLGSDSEKSRSTAEDGEPLVYYFCIKYNNPLAIVTTNGRFEISYTRTNLVELTRNGIPREHFNPRPGSGWDIRKIFESLHGREIIGYEIEGCNTDTLDNTSTGNTQGVERDTPFIGHLKFILDNGQKLDFINDEGMGYLQVLDTNTDIAHLCADSEKKYLKTVQTSSDNTSVQSNS